MKPGLRLLHLIAATFTVLFLGAGARAQDYTSVVVIGDSLSDTGNDAAVSRAKYTVAGQLPGPFTGYTDGRFTDGPDTQPAARSYTGVWVEQLAAKLTAKPPILNSLAGGTNYAYGFAFTGNGTTDFTFGPANAFDFTINNMGKQLSDYLATNPTITNKTLFIVWGGANDLDHATSASDIITAATNEVAIVQALISAGATDFIVPNLPPLGLIPRNNGSPTTSAEANGASLAFDEALAEGLGGLLTSNPGKTLNIYPLDTFTLFNTIVGPPLYTGFTDVTDMSQNNLTVNPDTYLFWDSLHPTTYGHSILASTALTLLGPPISTTTALASSNIAVNSGTPVTLTATVTANAGTPMGTVAFLDGTTSLGTGLVLGTTTNATATLTTSALTAGTHSLTASFGGVNGYTSSTSSAVSEVVTAPAYSALLQPSSIVVSRGGSGSTTISFAAVGGFTGTFTLACGTLPTHFTCSFASPTVTLSGASASDSVQITTGATTAQLAPVRPFGNSEQYGGLAVAFVLFGGLASSRRSFRRRGFNALIALIMLLSVGALAGLTGCGSDKYANDAPTGSYTVPITVTPATGTAQTLTLTVVIQ